MNFTNIQISALEHVEIQDQSFINANIKFFIMSILYASYNSVLLIPILITIKKFITKNNKQISTYVTIITFILLTTIYLFLINYSNEIKGKEMPAVFAIGQIFPSFKIIYGIMILISIFTTATSLGISFLHDVSKNEKEYNIIAIVISVTGVIFSKIGFANLVQFLYPILGILGFFQIIEIFKSSIVKKKV